MRLLALSVLVILSLFQVGGIISTLPASTTSAASPAKETKEPVDFDRQLKPIFESKCMPCHFSGGKMYESLPFDKPATIRKLGTRLFTRIKDENERRLIDEFIHQAP